MLTRTVGVINLSQFLLATVTVLSWQIAFHSSAKFVTPALDKSCTRDNFIVRRDWQKLRHGGLPAVTIFWLKYQDSYRRTAPPTFTPSTAGPLYVRFTTSDNYTTMTVTLHITSMAKYFNHMPGRQRTSKSLAAATATPNAAAKHMLFLPVQD